MTVIGLWMAIIGYGVLFAGAAKLNGKKCTIGQAFRGTGDCIGSGNTSPGNPGNQDQQAKDNAKHPPSQDNASCPPRAGDQDLGGGMFWRPVTDEIQLPFGLPKIGAPDGQLVGPCVDAGSIAKGILGGGGRSSHHAQQRAWLVQAGRY